MSDYCITTLSAGSKYNKYLLDGLLSNKQVADSGADILVTTDDPDYFKDTKAKTFAFTPEYIEDVRENRTKKWFNYHQKRIAIRNAHESGYKKIFYIDSDIEVLNWDENFFIKRDKGFWFRTQLSREQHIEKYNFYDKLYRVDKWHYYRPVSEKIIYINECSDKVDGFLNIWEHLAEEARGKINPFSEGHEILISLRFNGANTQRYKPDPFKGGNKKMRDAHL